MKKKGKYLPGILLLAAVLMVTTGITCVQAAEQNQDSQSQSQPAEPAKPESYEWEIQSNKIPGWPQGPKVVAQTAILMDLDTGAILYAKGIDEKREPASTTKIMTGLLAIEKVPFDTKITFTNEVNNIETGSTHIGIKPGETLTMEDSIHGILLASANEVSSGVAEYVGGTVSAFIDMMNQRASELGCKNTHFSNAHGLHSDDHYTTARDLAIIARAAFQNETFRNVIKTPYYIIPTTNITNETRWINNHHKMLLDGAQHYEGCLGGKTGYTEKAGNTLVTYAERNGMRLVCVVLADINEHYTDSAAIFDYGFNNFQKMTPEPEVLETAPDSFGAYLKEQGLLYSALQDYAIDIPKNASQNFSIDAAVEGASLKTDYYYGETLLSSNVTEASLEVLDAYAAFSGQSQPEKTAVDPVQKEVKELSSDDSKTAKEKASNNVPQNLKDKFSSLPNWKYPALLFLAAAFLFYAILLIVRIRRASKRKKRRKSRRKKKRGKKS